MTSASVAASGPAVISIIIPAYKEAGQIGPLLRYLREVAGPDVALELLVVDGHSPDSTATEAAAAGARVLLCPRRGRAAQLNFGAAAATGSIFYFLHADTYPPVGFTGHIRAAVAGGVGWGSYRLRFDHPSRFLALHVWFTRFPQEVFRFGDQSLFVRRDVFEQAGGYREDMMVFEDQKIARRLRRVASLQVLSHYVVTSARKYRENGVWRLQGIYYLITAMYRLGMSQQRMVQVYRRLIRQDKM